MAAKAGRPFECIPKVDVVLARPEWQALAGQAGPSHAAAAVRGALAGVRSRLANVPETDPAELVEQALWEALEAARLEPLQPVINATGVVLHTNLGRAVIPRELWDDVAPALISGCNLEIDLVTGRRGERGRFVRRALARMCGAEAALIVNNNAAGVLLALSAVANGREVVVSRGELVQIGGGFRIPEVIQQGGARLCEVGTTNVTTLDDYRRAVGPDTGAILSVHRSNFTQSGFVAAPTTAELAALTGPDLPLIVDLGSGNPLARHAGRAVPDPTPAGHIADGADLVCFSGDKLLGGPQAGVVAGSAKLIERVARHPLMRAVRPDRTTYLLLQAVVVRYDRGEAGAMSPWRCLEQDRNGIRRRVEGFLFRHGQDGARFAVVDTLGEYGGGSLPGETIESAGLKVAVADPDRLSARLRRGRPPVVALVRRASVVIDFLTVDPEQEPSLASALREALASGPESAGPPD